MIGTESVRWEGERHCKTCECSKPGWNAPADVRLKGHVLVDPETGCWDWQATIGEDGYGTFQMNRRRFKAHRASYLLFVGEIPPGLVLDHLCRNTACVNPAHLEAVTIRENTLRGRGPTAEGARRTHCLYGHPLDGVSKRGWRYCKTCMNAHSAEWREANRDKHREAQRRYRAARKR